MKLEKILIIVAAVVTVLSIISKLAFKPVAGVAARPLMGFAGLLLLFVIALEGLKK